MLSITGGGILGSGSKTFTDVFNTWWEYELTVTVVDTADHKITIDGTVTHLFRGTTPMPFSLAVNARLKRSDVLSEEELSKTAVEKNGYDAITEGMLTITLPIGPDPDAVYQTISGFSGSIAAMHIVQAGAGGDPHFETWR